MVSSPIVHHILYILRTRQATQKMKKTYIRPSAETYTVHAIQMIAESQIGKGDDLTDDNMDGVDILGREDNDSKSHNIWNKEW